MTDNSSNNNGADIPEHAPQAGSSDDLFACSEPNDAGMREDETDGGDFAVRIEESGDPGTILIAVADPPKSDDGSPGGGEGEGGDERQPTEGGVKIPLYNDLTEIAAVRLPGLGPALFFLAAGVCLAPGDNVVVEMEEGQAFGETASLVRMNPAHLLPSDGGKLHSVLRKATEDDERAAEDNAALTKESLEFCRQCIKERDLDMKLVDVLTLHDRGKMVFYFTAPARIDFRELVKDLVRRYRTRIELRQIGVRHETQMVGALGNCGMVCCCRRYLRKFAPVAIKMAKEQNVFLNPVKISGICGRLLCCLAYEQGHYDEFYRSCPKLGKKYHTDVGVVRVLRASLFRESVTVLSETNEEKEYSLVEWNGLNPFRPNAGQQSTATARKQEPKDPGGVRSGNDEKLGKSPHASRSTPRQGKNDPARVKPHSGVGIPNPNDMGEDGVVVAETNDAHTHIAAASHRRVESAPVLSESAAEEFADGADDDGSIFGFSPQRRETVSEESGDGGKPRLTQEGQSARRKKPHRRQGRRKPGHGPDSSS